MRMAIRAMVAIHPEIEIVGEAVDGEEAVELATGSDRCDHMM